MGYIKNILKVFILIYLLLQLFHLNNANADNNIKIIGCINTITLETREPSENGNCLFGLNWQNIMLPWNDQLNKWWKVFETKNQIINRLPIVNFESGFDPYAENSIAIWYVQTLKKYKIWLSIEEQLTWMKNRMESQKEWNCSQWVEFWEERLLRCFYARHYGALSWYHWYPNKLIAARNYYIQYFEKIEKNNT